MKTNITGVRPWLHHSLQRLALATTVTVVGFAAAPVPSPGRKNPDVGQTNISAYSHGVVGHRTPNIDRLAKEGMMFTDSYGEQSCTAGH